MTAITNHHDLIQCTECDRLPFLRKYINWSIWCCGRRVKGVTSQQAIDKWNSGGSDPIASPDESLWLLYTT